MSVTLVRQAVKQLDQPQLSNQLSVTSTGSAKQSVEQHVILDQLPVTKAKSPPSKQLVTVLKQPVTSVKQSDIPVKKQEVATGQPTPWPVMQPVISIKKPVDSVSQSNFSRQVPKYCYQGFLVPLNQFVTSFPSHQNFSYVPQVPSDLKSQQPANNTNQVPAVYNQEVVSGDCCSLVD